jgi:peptide/nickel transport system substrate-binding protein
MEIVYDLAKSFEVSADGLTYTFALRDDAYFTDGKPVTAADVAFTIEKAKESGSSVDLSFVESAAAPDEHTAVFTLSQPISTFLGTLCSIGIVPEHAYSENYGNEPIGSGPYKLVQWNKGEQVILERNEDYYGEAPAIPKVTLLFMAEDAAFAAAKAGEVNVALTSATLADQDIDGMKLARVSTADNRGFTLPVNPAGGISADGNPAGNDVTCNLEIRRAIAYCIDREKLAEDALAGYGDPAYSENDGMPWNNLATKIETDVEKAKTLLADGGWADTDGDGIVEKDGLAAAFTCIYPSGDSVRQAVAMAASAQARDIGIDITVEGVSWDDIMKRMYSDAVLMGWGSSNPYTSYLLYHSSSALKDDFYDPEGFADETVDAHLDAALHATDMDIAYNEWKLAQWDDAAKTGTAMQGECPWVWLVNVQHLYYVSEGLDIGTQPLHALGADWTLLQNLSEWKWN